MPQLSDKPVVGRICDVFHHRVPVLELETLFRVVNPQRPSSPGELKRLKKAYSHYIKWGRAEGLFASTFVANPKIERFLDDPPKPLFEGELSDRPPMQVWEQLYERSRQYWNRHFQQHDLIDQVAVVWSPKAPGNPGADQLHRNKRVTEVGVEVINWAALGHVLASLAEIDVGFPANWHRIDQRQRSHYVGGVEDPPEYNRIHEFFRETSCSLMPYEGTGVPTGRVLAAFGEKDSPLGYPYELLPVPFACVKLRLGRQDIVAFTTFKVFEPEWLSKAFDRQLTDMSGHSAVDMPHVKPHPDRLAFMPLLRAAFDGGITHYRIY